MAKLAKAVEDKISRLEDLLLSASPVEWVQKQNIQSAFDWENERKRALEDMKGVSDDNGEDRQQ